MRNILKNSFSISFAALISRILGVLRDVLIATMFGANLYSDIFFLVFRIPDFLRKIFSEGILSSSFVPVFSRHLTARGEGRAFEMVNSAFLFISACTAIVTISGIIFMPYVIGLFVPGFSEKSYEFNLTVLLSRIMMPYFIFICLLAVCMGVLNTLKSFKTPAFAPVVFNMVIIFFTLVVCEFFDPPVIGLALGVTIGGFAQLVLQVPFLIRKKVFRIKKIVLIHPGVVEFMKRLFPTVIGASTFHINLLAATFFASFFDKGSISYLYYADRLVQLPMALISGSLAIVFLPLFSKNAVLKEKNESIIILVRGLKLVLFIIIPAMAGLIALNEPIVKLFFFHGAFDIAAVNNTCICLSYLILGLWAYSGTRILVSFFHAFSDIITPLKAGIATIILNLLLSIVLMKMFGFKGLAIAISISGMFNFVVLLIKLNAFVPVSFKEIGFSACRAVFISGIMYFIIKVLILKMNNIWHYAIPIPLTVAMSVVIGILIYFMVNVLINSPEIKMIRNEIFKKSKS